MFLAELAYRRIDINLVHLIPLNHLRKYLHLILFLANIFGCFDDRFLEGEVVFVSLNGDDVFESEGEIEVGLDEGAST